MTNYPTIVHLLGNTGAGKTTLMNYLIKTYQGFYGISVGQVLRSRHPPEYFQGSAAPKHTEEEAFDIYRDYIDWALSNPDARTILIDGMPRTTSQVSACLNIGYPGIKHEFVLIHADYEERKQRLIAERTGGSLDLAMARLHNDYANQYEVMVELALKGLELQIFPTTYEPIRHLAFKFVDRYYGQS